MSCAESRRPLYLEAAVDDERQSCRVYATAFWLDVSREVLQILGVSTIQALCRRLM